LFLSVFLEIYPAMASGHILEPTPTMRELNSGRPKRASKVEDT